MNCQKLKEVEVALDLQDINDDLIIKYGSLNTGIPLMNTADQEGNLTVLSNKKLFLETRLNKIDVDELAILLNTFKDILNELPKEKILELCLKNPSLRKLVKNPPKEMLMADL